MKKEFLKLNIKKFLIIVGVWLLSVVLHNLVSAWFNVEEAIFFITAIFIVPIYFLVSLVYTVVIKVKK